MPANRRIITRRDFIRTGSRVVMGGLMGLPLIRSAVGQSVQKSKVVLIRDQHVTDGYGSLKEDIVTDMLDRAVAALMGTPGPESAWRKLVKPDDVIGIKSNVWRPLPSPEALEDVIVSRLMEAGVSKAVDFTDAWAAARERAAANLRTGNVPSSYRRRVRDFFQAD